MKLDICGVTVKAVRSRGRALRLKVNAVTGEVTLSVPNGVSVAEATRFAKSKREWILSNLPGSCAPWDKPVVKLFGKDTAVSYGVRKEGAVFLPRADTSEERRAALERYYKAVLTGYIAERMPDLEKLTGLKCTGFTVRAMKTRWGSCTTATGKLRFNLYLAAKQREAVDYVIVHELAHLLHPDHGKAFKDFLTSVMPDWKERKKFLSE